MMMDNKVILTIALLVLVSFVTSVPTNFNSVAQHKNNCFASATWDILVLFNGSQRALGWDAAWVQYIQTGPNTIIAFFNNIAGADEGPYPVSVVGQTYTFTSLLNGVFPYIVSITGPIFTTVNHVVLYGSLTRGFDIPDAVDVFIVDVASPLVMDIIMFKTPNWPNVCEFDIHSCLAFGPRQDLLDPNYAIMDLWQGASGDDKFYGWYRNISQDTLFPVVSAPAGASLMTHRHYWNFQLHIEFRFNGTTLGFPDSGIFLRGRYEMNLFGDKGPPTNKSNLSIYGRLAPRNNADVVPLGQWNTLDITLVENSISAVCNGITIYDNDIIGGLTGNSLDPFEGCPGPIMLQNFHMGARNSNQTDMMMMMAMMDLSTMSMMMNGGQTSWITFRNVTIQPLSCPTIHSQASCACAKLDIMYPTPVKQPRVMKQQDTTATCSNLVSKPELKCFN